MKNSFIILIFLVIPYFSNAQVKAVGTTNSGTAASAICYQTEATNNYSFSAGWLTKAYGIASTALGYNSLSQGDYSISMGRNCSSLGSYSYSFGMNAVAGVSESVAIGSYMQTTASGAISIGTSDAGSEMINNINSSLMIGFNSKVPTFYVSTSPFSPEHNTTGNIGIATTNPRAKLHVNGDTYINNDLAIGNEITNASLYISSLRSDGRQFIVADKNGKLSLVTDAEIPGDNLGNHAATMDNFSV